MLAPIAAYLLAALGPAAAPAPEPTGPLAPPQVDARLLLARLAASDPPVHEVQAAAARRAAASADEAEGWRSRVRLAPLVPKVVAWAKRDDRTQHVVGLTASAEVDYLRIAPGTEVGVRLSWSLDDLVFSEAELRAAEAAAQAARRRLEAAEKATRLYFHRRELLLGLWLSPPADPASRAAAELAIDLATAELDALTGGMFGGRR